MIRVKRVLPAWQRSEMETLLDRMATSYSIRTQRTWPEDSFVVEYEARDDKTKEIDREISRMFGGDREDKA